MSVLNMFRHFSRPSLDNLGHFLYCRKCRGGLKYSAGYMCMLYANTTPVYVGYLEYVQILASFRVLGTSVLGFEGMAI